MIKVDVKRKAFGDDEILRDIHFEMAVGEALAILGPSGIGKSTLLRVIAGIDHAFEGEIDRPEKIAMVFQEPVLLPWRSVLEDCRGIAIALDQHDAGDHNCRDRQSIGDDVCEEERHQRGAAKRNKSREGGKENSFKASN
jgi:ABC-type nitrate/sulfonate/bicarbonate transport system ATPase subunit